MFPPHVVEEGLDRSGAAGSYPFIATLNSLNGFISILLPQVSIQGFVEDVGGCLASTSSELFEFGLTFRLDRNRLHGAIEGHLRVRSKLPSMSSLPSLEDLPV